jgi:hypothetical protein
MTLYNEDPLNTAFGINIYHADGKPSDYDIFGTTTSGQASGSFTLSNNEQSGIMDITITDYDNEQSDNTYIEVSESGEAESDYLSVIIPFNEPHNEVWVPGTEDSGYTSWYTKTETTYTSVPFTVANTGKDTVRIDGTIKISLPRIKASFIHFLTASSNQGDCE